MASQLFNDTDRSLLQELIVHASDARIVRRAYALLWSDEGEALPVIAKRLGVSRQTIYNWVARFQARAGTDLTTRLADGGRSGRPKTASGVIDPLLEAIWETDPRTLGYRATVWTAPLLVHYLAHTQHVVVSCQSVRLALARLRLRWKRPRHTLALRPDHWRQAKGG